MYDSLEAVRLANVAAGQTWFGEDEIRFFSTTFDSEIINGRWFVTGEDPGYGRRWTIRRANDDGTITTVGDFMGWADPARAIRAARALSD